MMVLLMTVGACASLRSAPQGQAEPYIDNPFGGFGRTDAGSRNITFRSKKGDKQMEVEIPQDGSSDFEVPMSPKFASDGPEGRNPASADGIDYQYVNRKASIADREIASTLGKNEDPISSAKRREIEFGLGLQPSDELPNMDSSYLAKVDIVKQLFHSGRLEAAILELDALIKEYPTNAKLYEMRGTVLDRLGYGDLAIRSWKQALEFEPGKLSLKKLVERRETQRSVASEKR
jgi:tetratricopeptide (TPR) repeat protein